MATKDVKEFNGWFNRSYARLKESVSLYGKINEDAFHDAYLAVRKQVMFSNNGIEDLESYFFGCIGKSCNREQGKTAVTTTPGTSISQDWVRRTARKRPMSGKRCLPGATGW